MALRTPRSPAVVLPVDPTVPSLATLGRLRRFYAVRPSLAFAHIEQWLSRRLAHNGLMVTRVALGIIFLWFGVLKFMPAITPIDSLAERTLVLITFHQFPPAA